MAELSKVQFGLSRAYYSVLTNNTYGTPVALPGAVSLTLNREGSEPEKFYADNITYFVAPAVNSGYTGTLTLAKVPASFGVDVLGEVVDDNGMQVEIADANPKSFALLFQVDGDADEELYVLYNVTGTRPNIGSQTNEATKEPRTQSSDITAIPLADGRVLARTTADTPTATKTGWFTTVFQES